MSVTRPPFSEPEPGRNFVDDIADELASGPLCRFTRNAIERAVNELFKHSQPAEIELAEKDRELSNDPS